MKFKDFQAPVLFSSTFKALNLGGKIQVLSRTFKDAWEHCVDAPPTVSKQALKVPYTYCRPDSRIMEFLYIKVTKVNITR